MKSLIDVADGSLIDYEITRKELSKIYDELSLLHDKEREEYYDNSEQLYMLNDFLPLNATILDAGCGTGYPVLKFFHDKGHNVVGTDISPGQLEFVKIHAPSAKILVCDTSELKFPEDNFDLITSFYSLMHLPLSKQLKAFYIFFKILKKESYVYFTLASKEYTGKDEYSGVMSYGGHNFPIHHTTVSEYKRILETIGFTTLEFEHKNTGKGINFLWYLGKK